MALDRRYGAAWMRALIGLLLGILLCAPEDVSGQAVYSTSSRFKSKTSVLSLFDMARSKKFWTDTLMWRSYDDFERFESHDLSKKALANFTGSGRIAKYLNMTEIDAIYLPVPITFVFIGFDGHGNHDVKLREDEMERWFTNIDHVLEHTRIPQLGDDLTPFYKVGADGTPRPHLPLVSYTHYNYSVHTIDMGTEVTKLFEYAIKVLSRREDTSDSRPDSEVTWQVDMDSMSYLFESLTHYLQLEDAYNIYVLNPKRDESRKTYGYRRGLSISELKLVAKNSNLKSLKTTKQRNPLDIEKLRKPSHEKHPRQKFSWTSSQHMDMKQWTQKYTDALKSIEASMKSKASEELLFMKTQQVLSESSHDLAFSLKRTLKNPDAFKTVEECLVDTWTGQGRWAFIDLTAGPFHWGPTVGGVGVRTVGSLPSVEKLFGSLAVNGGVISNDDHIQELQEAMDGRFTTMDDGHGAIDVLLAEVDVYDMFAEKHCRGRKIKIALCQELQERMDDLKDELDSLRSEGHDEEHQKKALAVLQRVEKWNLFGDIHEHVQNFSVARDSFLAHLGATLTAGMKHVITPSTAEGAFHYYDKVSIQIYVITEERTRHIGLLPLDISQVKDAISTLRLPSQTFQYNVHLIGLSEDPALAMAFSVARRAAVIPVLQMNGAHSQSTRNYLDSIILQHQLQQLTARSPRSVPKSTLEVPVFWFIRSDESVFIDKHYLAKALPDMVIVMQSAQSSWPSHLQCNGKSIDWDASSPIKAAVAAVAEHLSGLMPTHLTYSHAHDNADEDWTWSAGNHPFSGTSSGYTISSLHTDAIARSYIVSALDESVQEMNAVFERLSKEPTHERVFRPFKSMERQLLQEYNSVVGIWRQISINVGKAKFDDAVRSLSSLRHASERLTQQSDAIITALHPLHCTQHGHLHVPRELFACFGLAVVAVMLRYALWPRRLKPKIN
ncbi:uncharacterized protein LOC9659220 isoform X2 [Selaginella moellendorffii]|uniref:uncharacterized protein LOC9659220 isoform X2 n=1 Tax=Selaginella moellendorffii TaxID=88036 RepID=UPI000D1CE0CF|nr:uncharacterized protein LOC9659220 isoform X2 [Selaginella moellendorffii]|eukprot:XP_024530236.1 uncharacterized protein LOC9659220 isoform X2 [Selaginella moellendorffii]